MGLAGYVKALLDFAETTTPANANGSALWVNILPGEEYDPFAVSRRVYGTRNESFVILTIAGIQALDVPMEQGKLLCLPSPEKLRQLRSEHGV